MHATLLAGEGAGDEGGTRGGDGGDDGLLAAEMAGVGGGDGGSSQAVADQTRFEFTQHPTPQHTSCCSSCRVHSRLGGSIAAHCSTAAASVTLTRVQVFTQRPACTLLPTRHVAPIAGDPAHAPLALAPASRQHAVTARASVALWQRSLTSMSCVGLPSVVQANAGKLMGGSLPRS